MLGLEPGVSARLVSANQAGSKELEFTTSRQSDELPEILEVLKTLPLLEFCIPIFQES